MAGSTSRLEPGVLGAFLGVVLIGGGNFVVVRFSNDELAPFWGASLRFLSAGILLLVFAMARSIDAPRGRALVGSLLYGALGFGVSYAFAYWSLVGLHSALLAVLTATVPLLTFFLAMLVGLERFRTRALLGALLGVAGIGIILREQLTLAVPWQYLLGGLLTAFSIAASSIVAKWFPRPHPVAANALGMITGGLLLAALSQTMHESMALPRAGSTIAAVVYLVLVGSILMFGLFLFVLARLTASATSYQMVLAPLVTFPLAAILRHETVTWTFAAGSLIVLGGVYVGVVAGKKPGPVTAPAAEPPQSAASGTDARGP